MKTHSDHKDPHPSILFYYNSLIVHIYHSPTYITPLRFSLTYFLSSKCDFAIMYDFHDSNDSNDSRNFNNLNVVNYYIDFDDVNDVIDANACDDFNEYNACDNFNAVIREMSE